MVIGGGSLRGGEGSVVGTLIGAFIMGLLSNGSDLLGIRTYWQQVIIGAVIILAVTVDEVAQAAGAVVSSCVAAIGNKKGPGEPGPLFKSASCLERRSYFFFFGAAFFFAAAFLVAFFID